MYFKDIIVECPEKDIVKIYKGNVMVINDDSLLVFQLNDNIKELMENELKGKINGISIIHLLIEDGIENYKERLRDLIDYIIYDQQNDIVSDQMFLVNKEEAYHEAALEVIKEKQKKITKNTGDLFPTEKTATLTPTIESYHFAFSNRDAEKSYFGEISLITDFYTVDLDEDDELDEDKYYEYEAVDDNPNYDPTDKYSESTTTIVKEITNLDLIKNSSGKFTINKLKARGYQSVVAREKWTRDTYTLHCREYRSKNMGSLFTSVSTDEFDIIITKLVNPHYYNVIPDNG